MQRTAREDGLAAPTAVHQVDLAVVGGGMAGVCCAITAARAGARVVLVTDRPVLGGNASSEVRLWILGATSHMGNNNRWAREGGVIDEILVENLYRNPEGNPVIFDTVLLDKVLAEPRITLLLNTVVTDLTKNGSGIGTVEGFNSQTGTWHELRSPLYCDASGDGILGFLAGATYRVGAEHRAEAGEGLAPDPSSYGETLGHTIYFYSRDTGKPVTYVTPSFASKNTPNMVRRRGYQLGDQGCTLWWIEHGGRMDTVRDTEKIKLDLWRLVYGMWDFIKNSGEYPEAANHTLDWVGLIPGKRESRRFEGPYMLNQVDVMTRKRHFDAVSSGGWSIDLHPADGMLTSLPPCNQWHARAPYSIPYRCMFSKDVPNLFLAGRLMSVSHVAFGSTRVMATGAQAAQAVGMAAAICKAGGMLPAQLAAADKIKGLQRELLLTGQHIPGLSLGEIRGLAAQAEIGVTSSLRLDQLPFDGPEIPLDRDVAQMLPMQPGPAPVITMRVTASAPTTLRASLRISKSPDSYVPDRTLGSLEFELTGPVAEAVAEPEPAPMPKRRTTKTPPPEVVEEAVVATVTDEPVAKPKRRTTKAAAEPVAEAPAAEETPTKPRSRSTKSLAVKAAETTVVTREIPILGAGTQEIRLDFGVNIPEAAYVYVCLIACEGVTVTGSNFRATGLLSLRRSGEQRVGGPIGVEGFDFWTPERRPGGHNLGMTIEPGLAPFGAENLSNGRTRPTPQGPNAWVADPSDPSPMVVIDWGRGNIQAIDCVELWFDTDFDHPMESVQWGHPERVMPFCVGAHRIRDAEGNLISERTENHQTKVVHQLAATVQTDRLFVELDVTEGRCPPSLFAVRVTGP